MERNFFDFGNWTCKLANTERNKTVYNIDVDLKGVGFRFGHMNYSQLNEVFNRKSWAGRQFDYFRKNGKRLFFVIDFTRGAYKGYSNS